MKKTVLFLLLLSLPFVAPMNVPITLAASPVLAVTTDKASYLAGETVQISGQFYDEENPIALTPISVMINEPIGSIISVDQTTTDQSGAYHLSYPLAADLGDGVYRITVAGQDILSQVDFYIGTIQDLILPVSLIALPLNGAALTSSPILITGTATDNLGLHQVEISTDGGASWELAGGTYSWNYLWMHPTGGVHTIQSRASDLAGNQEVPMSGITVTVAIPGTPSPTSSSPTPTASLTSIPTSSPQPTPVSTPSLPALPIFPDTEFHWGRASIERLAKANLVSGYPDGFFRPDIPVTRMEFTKILVLALHLEHGTPTQGRFTDVLSSAWGFSYVEAAADAGIVNGVGEGQFAPDRNINRAEIATMIARALKLNPQSPNFSDAAQIPSYASGMVGAVSAKGIVQGYPDGTFRPANLATRAEAAAMTDRMLSLPQ